MNYTGDITTITDALGFITTITLDESSRILDFDKPCGDDPKQTTLLTTSCNYDPNGNCTTVIKPNNAKTIFSVNSAGLITQRISANGQTTEYDFDDETFACVIQRKLISDDGKNQQWAVTRYVYENKLRQNGSLSFRNLAFIISPTGTVTEYRYDANGTLQSTRTYLKNNDDIDTLSPTTSLTYDQLTTWITTQPRDQITLTTVSENNRGQLTQRQQFTEINSDGTGKNTDDASDDNYLSYTLRGSVQIATQKVDRDISGNDIIATTQKTSDALERTTSIKNPLGETQQITYNDPTKNAVITQVNGRTETIAWDDAGQITSKTTQIPTSQTARTSAYQYDSAGRVISTTGVDWQTTYQLFDSLNRPRFIVTPMGRVTEYTYDDINRFTAIKKYYNTVSISTATQPLTIQWIKSNLVIDIENDATTYQSFDLSGRLQFEVDGRGAVTEHRYDLCNREITKINYDAQITEAELSALKVGNFSRTPSTTDIVTTTFYDNDDHIVATQDGDGYITQHVYNYAGFEISRTQYATPVNVNLTSTPIYPASSNDDYTQFYYYDARGQKRVTVDGINNANFIAQQTFLATGKLKSKTRYANSAAAQPTISSDSSTLIPAVNTEDEVTTYDYDLLSRVIAEHLPQMRLRTITFDAMHNVIQTTLGDDPTQLPPETAITTQTTAKQFDAWDQVTAEATPLVYAKIAAIENNAGLSESQKQTQIAAIWASQALRHQYNDVGLHTASIDIIPDDVDDTDNTKLPITYFYYDFDQRLTITVKSHGQTKQTTWHPIFKKPLKTQRYATAINTADLTGGFITPAITALMTSSTSDSIEKYTYDGAGAQNSHIDGDGFQTITQMNMFGVWNQKILPTQSTTPTLILQ